MNNKLYTSGEFARLCRTQKSTLLVYEKKGLLKPSATGENGYRYYTDEQYIAFQVIKNLQFAGTSLSKISEILNSNDKDKLYETLEANRAALAKQQTELIQMQNYVDTLLASADMLYYSDSRLHTKYCPREYLIATPSGHGSYSENENSSFWENINRHLEYCESKGYINSKNRHVFDLISGENFKNGNIYPSFICSKIDFETNDPFLKIKPSGTYASMIFYGSWENIPENCRIFKEQLQNHGLKAVGDCYVRDVLFSILLSGEENHAYTLSIKVET